MRIASLLLEPRVITPKKRVERTAAVKKAPVVYDEEEEDMEDSEPESDFDEQEDDEEGQLVSPCFASPAATDRRRALSYRRPRSEGRV